MELKTNQAVITANEPTGNVLQEQGIELDYVLPDYYPDVCKLIKCWVNPAVINETLNGNRLSYELKAEVRILYCSENSNILQCVTQILRFPKSAELPAGENLTVDILPECDYVNCRAVSRRRLDVRGAVTIRMKTHSVRQQEALTDIPEKEIQLQKIPVQYPALQLHTVKSIIVSEELDLGTAKPPVLHVVRCDAKAVEQSQKLISGKLMVQGNLQLQLLYACENEGDGSLEPMAFRIPYSQLIDMDGLEEGDECRTKIEIVSCETKPLANAEGDIRQLKCEAELRVSCTAIRMATESLVNDAFSTEHPYQCEYTDLISSSTPVSFSEMLSNNVNLPCTDEELDCVYDAWCEIHNVTTAIESGILTISGMLNCQVLVREQSGMPRLLEREEPFEHHFPVLDLAEQDLLQVNVSCENCSYTLNSTTEVALKAELRMEGTITHCRTVKVLSNISIQEDETHPRQYALKLYFGKKNEPVWEIAKRCYTSVEAIMDENDLTQETLTDDGMLLIPIVG